MTAVRRLLGRLRAALAWAVSAADGHPAPLAGLLTAAWIIACLWFAHQVGRNLHDGYGGRPVMLERR